MFPAAAGKGERRSLRGSARLSSKMSGRLPRLRALRPRPQQQQKRARASEPVAVVTDATTSRPESNLKGAAATAAAASHEVEYDGAKRHDAKKGEDTAAGAAAAAVVSRSSEMDEGDNEDDDDDDDVTVSAVDVDEEQEEEEEEEVMLDGNVDVDVDVDIDVDVDVAVNADDALDAETQASYECKTCDPPKTLSSIKAYFEHLRKEHRYKVNTLARTLSALSFEIY